MGVSEDVRKVVQDLVVPELKSLAVNLDNVESESKLRDEALSAKIDSKFEALNSKMDAQYAAIMYALDLNRRVETLERDKQTASA